MTRNFMSTTLAALALCSAAASAAFAAPLVVNGNFELTTNGAAKQLGYNTVATGWSTSGYNFIFAPGSADTSGAFGRYGALMLWGPAEGAANRLVDSPTGGNFIGADGAYQVGAISQTIHGLTIGKQYTVGFDWAGAQQYNFDGANTEQWIVSLGNDIQSTTTYNNPSHGFSGWMHQSFSFAATSTSELLSFLARGTPEGKPPFSLLDNVTVDEALPEPSSVATLLTGLGLMAWFLRRRNGRAH